MPGLLWKDRHPLHEATEKLKSRRKPLNYVTLKLFNRHIRLPNEQIRLGTVGFYARKFGL